MKLHRNLAKATVYALWETFSENKYVDKVLERILKSDPRWGARDRGFIAESTYEIVRWWRLFTELDSNDLPLTSEEKYWRILGVWLVWKKIEIPNWEEFNGINPRKIQADWQKIQNIRKITQSIPDWLDELGTAELGENWDKELEISNQEAQLVLRTNTLKTSISELQKRLASQNIETDRLDWASEALVLQKRQNVFSTESFHAGFFEVQDAGSQLIAPFLEVESGMRVIDACAGAGGKTLHLASLMGNKGKIIAMDTEAHKLQELQKRAKRNGVQIIETRHIESSKTIKRLADSADRLLLDVPCSGLGVLRRNPDAKWKLSKEFIEKVQITQQDILQRYTQMLRKGGKLVYATCSLLPSENEKQVARFLESQNGKFRLLRQQSITPASHGFDGFFMALLEKIN